MVYPDLEASVARIGMADYEPGSMDIDEQERTFESFVTWTIRVVFAILIGLILLAFING